MQPKTICQTNPDSSIFSSFTATGSRCVKDAGIRIRLPNRLPTAHQLLPSLRRNNHRLEQHLNGNSKSMAYLQQLTLLGKQMLQQVKK